MVPEQLFAKHAAHLPQIHTAISTIMQCMDIVVEDDQVWIDGALVTDSLTSLAWTKLEKWNAEFYLDLLDYAVSSGSATPADSGTPTEHD